MIGAVTSPKSDSMRKSPHAALLAAIKAAGSQQALADALTAMGFRITQPSISEWLQRGVIPEDRCWPIELVVQGAARCEEMRPDIKWVRDQDGRVVSMEKPVTQPETKPKPRKRAGRRNPSRLRTRRPESIPTGA